MYKKGNAALGVIIVALIGIVIALSLMPEIARTTKGMTEKNSVLNETISLATVRNISGTSCNLNGSVTVYVTNAPTGWKASDGDCGITSATMRTQNGSVMAATTDYVLTAATGGITFKNTVVNNQSCSTNVTTIDYKYCLDGYVSDSGSKSITSLILIFSALGLLGFVVWALFKSFRE